MFKKYCISFLAFSLACLLLCAGVVFCIDPFNHYRANEDMTKIIHQNAYHQNIGIAKHTKYDTLITGSSMTQNFRAYWFDEIFNCRAICLPFEGGCVSDYYFLLDTALKNNKDLKTVYFGIDNFMFAQDNTMLFNENSKIPSWQTDNNLLSDVNYLFNKDVLTTYLRINFSYRFSGFDFYEQQCWDNVTDLSEYSKENAIGDVSLSDERQPMLPDSYFSEQAENFCDKIFPILKENPHIEFIFFAPPPSIVYWYRDILEGKMNATFSAMQTVYEGLLDFDNVQLFFFQNDMEKITNLDMYKDYYHYHTDYNRWMLSEFQNTTYLLTKETCLEVLEEMKNTVQTFNYADLFS